MRSEDPFSLSERRSSSDSNKVSSGELSPYDNNSPILSEHPGEGTSPGSERLFHVPEQYTLVRQVAGRTRDTHGSNPWVSKGEKTTVQSYLAVVDMIVVVVVIIKTMMMIVVELMMIIILMRMIIIILIMMMMMMSMMVPKHSHVHYVLYVRGAC